MTTDRNDYIAGLRALADALDTNAELPLPYHGGSDSTPILAFAYGKDAVAAWARAMPGKVEKKYDDTGDSTFGFQLRGSFAGLSIRVHAKRSDVCERVVTGTKTVIREVPDAVALAAVPTTTVTETVETVEWICSPLLAPESV